MPLHFETQESWKVDHQKLNFDFFLVEKNSDFFSASIFVLTRQALDSDFLHMDQDVGRRSESWHADIKFAIETQWLCHETNVLDRRLAQSVFDEEKRQKMGQNRVNWAWEWDIGSPHSPDINLVRFDVANWVSNERHLLLADTRKAHANPPQHGNWRQQRLQELRLNSKLLDPVEHRNAVDLDVADRRWLHGFGYCFECFRSIVEVDNPVANLQCVQQSGIERKNKFEVKTQNLIWLHIVIELSSRRASMHSMEERKVKISYFFRKKGEENGLPIDKVSPVWLSLMDLKWSLLYRALACATDQPEHSAASRSLKLIRDGDEVKARKKTSLWAAFTHPNFWLICWKNVVMLLSSRMSGGADVELPKPERAGADKSNSRKFWKPPK